MIIYLFEFNKLAAQTTYELPPNQPEQDACNALQLCGNSFYTPYSYTGIGKNFDLSSTPCFTGNGGGEVNSVWLKLRVFQTGIIVFKIVPVNPDDDYDFAVVDATNKNCSSLKSSDVVRCNFNSNYPGSNINGIVGLSTSSIIPYVQAGAIGESFAEAVSAKGEETYLIMINNYGNYVSGGPSKGFTIDFTGSTALFYSTATPQLNSVDVPCNNADSIIIKTNINILCSSIAADGSDFTTNATAKIISASGLNCTNNGGYTNSIVINFSSILQPGTYTINAKQGSDNNTLLGLCNNELVPANPLTFVINQGTKVAIDDESICYRQLPFIWHGLQLNGSDSGAVYVSKSAAGCDSTTVLNLHVSEAPQQVNISKTICEGDSYILPWDSTVTTAGTYTHHYVNVNGCDSVVENINVTVSSFPLNSIIETGFCPNESAILIPQNNFNTYLWSTGETSNSITVNTAGNYSLLATNIYGCITKDTFVVAAYKYPVATFKTVENLCYDSTKILDAGSGFINYLWNNGINTETITVSESGKYWVTLTDIHKCISTDTVSVVTVQRPANFLINSITKCFFDEATLTPLYNYTAYEWSNGSNTKTIYVQTAGLYWLTVTDYNGCKGRNSVTVTDSICPNYFYMPTAFTPNNDRHNDIFKPVFAGPVNSYHLSIYNRWGKLIFSSTDPSNGWNGSIQGIQQPVGTYVWMCSYSLYGQPLRTEKGTVTLVK